MNGSAAIVTIISMSTLEPTIFDRSVEVLLSNGYSIPRPAIVAANTTRLYTAVDCPTSEMEISLEITSQYNQPLAETTMRSRKRNILELINLIDKFKFSFEFVIKLGKSSVLCLSFKANY